MRIKTKTGEIPVPVFHVNGALNVVRVPTHNLLLELYNTVHNNGLRIPDTDAANLDSAIYICDSLAQKFPELINSDPQISSKLKTEIVDFLKRVHGDE